MAVIGVIGLAVLGLGIAQVYAAAGNRTAPDALALARARAQAVGTVVVACADRQGFAVNPCARFLKVL